MARRQRWDKARARAGGRRGARPARAAAGGGGEERPPAARAPNGPGWGCEVTVAARGSWEAATRLRSREVPEGKGEAPSALFHSQYVADPAAPPPARWGPRAAAAGAALTRYGAGGRPQRRGRG